MKDKDRPKEDLVRELRSLREKVKLVEEAVAQRTWVENALKEAEERYRALTEGSLQGTVIAQGIPPRLVEVSHRLAEMLGYTVEELRSLPASRTRAIIHPDVQEMFFRNYQERLEGRTAPSRYEIKVIRKDGEIRWLELFASAVEYNGKPAVQAAFVDVTEHKLAEQALRGSEGKYRKIFENIQDIFYHADSEGRIIDVSPSVERHSGYTREELIGRSILELYANPADRRKLLRTILAKGEVSDYEVRLKSKSGQVIHASVSARILFDAAGKPSGIEGSFRDISERKKSEESLRASEERYRLLFYQSPVGIFHYDTQLRITDLNDQLVTLLQSRRERLVGLDMKTLKDQRILPAICEAIQGHEGQYEGPYEATTSSAQIWALLKTAPVYDENGQVKGGIGIVEDLTKQREAAREVFMLAQALKSITDCVSITDTQDNILFVNDAFAKTYGYTPEELIGQSITVVRSARTPPDVAREVLPATLRGGWEGELLNRRKDGTEFPIYVSTSVVYDRDGSPIALIGAATDITERKQAEERLRESEERYRKLVESSPDAIAVHVDGRIQFVNDAAVKLMGAQCPEDLIGKPLMTFVHPDYHQTVKERVQQMIEEKKDVPLIEEKFIRLDGTIVDVEVAASPTTHQGKPAVQVVIRNVSERKRAEEALRQSEERYRGLIDSARDVIFTATPRGIITSLNPAFETITGWSRNEWLGKTYSDLFHGEDVAGAREYFLRALQGEPVAAREIRIRTIGGSYVVGEFTITSQKQNGKVVGLLGVARDVTERKRLEDQYRHAQKMESLGTLAGGIAHDFNNILAIILGHASLFPRNQGNPAKLAGNFDAIMKATHRGAALVKQLLTFASKSDILFESVQINHSVSETTKLLDETFPKTIIVRTKLQPDLPPVVADPNQLHQLLLNLCVNARDAMPKGGTISIATSLVVGDDVRARFATASADNYIALQVSDSGEGMDQATKRRIFEPFFTTKERGKGTGLGLATVYGIIESHGGFVDVESEVGVGTTFHVYLPAQSFPDIGLETVKESSEDVPGGSETILVVEDEDLLRELVKTVLTAKGYDVITASDGMEAVEVYSLHRSKIGLVVADIGLPRLAGSEVFMKLRNIDPDVKVILASGFFEPGFRTDMLKAGAKEVLQKPYQPNEILKIVRKALDS